MLEPFARGPRMRTVRSELVNVTLTGRGLKRKEGAKHFGFLGDQCGANFVCKTLPLPIPERFGSNRVALVEVAVAHEDNGLVQCPELRIPLSFQLPEFILAIVLTKDFTFQISGEIEIILKL